MLIICERTGTRERCQGCEHSKPHEYLIRIGCDGGRCLPNMVILNTITGEPIDTQQHYKCVDVPKTEITEEKVI